MAPNNKATRHRKQQEQAASSAKIFYQVVVHSVNKASLASPVQREQPAQPVAPVAPVLPVGYLVQPVRPAASESGAPLVIPGQREVRVQPVLLEPLE